MNLSRSRHRATSCGPWVPALVIAVLFVSLGGAGKVGAQTCSIWVNASDGNDANAGSQFAPVQSIEKGFNLTADQGRMCVSAGEYFRGDDEDGILLAGSGKSVTIELRSFAGADEIRLSEAFLIADPGSGVIRFARSASETLVIGTGIINSNAIHPDRLNFLHTFEVRSGHLDFGPVPVTLEEPVGNRTYVSPENQEKQAPSSAGIRFGGILTGEAINWSPTVRFWTIEGGVAGEERSFDIPPLVAPGSLDINAMSPVHFAGQIDVGSGGSIRVGTGQTGELRFDGPIALSDASSFMDAGDTEQSYAFSTSGQGVISITFAGSGRRTITGIGQEIGSRLDISSASAPLTLDFDGQVAGSLETDDLTILGQVELTGGANNQSVLTAAGSIDVSQGRLLVTSTEGGLSRVTLNAGLTWTGPALTVTGLVAIEAETTLPLELVAPATVTLDGASIFNSLLLVAGLDVTVSGRGASVLADLQLNGGTLRLEDGAGLSVEELLITDGEFLGGTSRVHVQNLVRIDGGNTQNIRIDLASSAPAFITSTHRLAELSVNANPTTVTGSLDVLESCSLQGGELLVGDESSLICGDFISIPGADVSLSAGASIVSTDNILFDGVNLSAATDTRLTVGGELEIRSSQATTESLTLVASSPDSRLVTDSVILMEGIEWQGSESALSIRGALELDGDLDLSEHSINLEQDTVLRLRSNISLSASGLRHAETSSVVFTETNEVSGSGPGLIVLPSVRIAGSTTVFRDSMSISGSLTHVSGTLALAENQRLSVSGAAVIQGNTATFAAGSTLDLGGSTMIDSPEVSLGTDAIIHVRSDLDWRSQASGTEQATLTGTGSGAWSLPSSIGWRHIRIEGEASAFSIGTLSDITILDRLLIGPGSTLDLVDSHLLLGSGPAANFNLEGTLAASGAGSLVWSGDGGSWSGTGSIDRLRIQLNQSSDSIEYEGIGTQVTKQLVIDSGLLSLGQSTLRFSDSAVTGIALRISESGFSGMIAADSPVNVNPENRTVDVSVSGTLSGFVALDPVFAFGPVRNLSLDTPDPFNDPPLFGLTHGSNIVLSGNLSVQPRTRLDAPSVMMTGSNSDHELKGVLGDVILSGSGTITGHDRASVRSLDIQQGEFESTDLNSIGSLHLDSSSLTLISGDSIAVSAGMIASESTMRFESPVSVESSSGQLAVALTGTNITLAGNSNWLLKGAVRLEADENSSFTSDVADEAPAGFVVVEGRVELNSAASIPRIRLPHQQSELQLGRDLTITNWLSSFGGIINLDSNSLILNNANWVDGSGTIYGAEAGQKGLIRLEGASTLTLWNDLNLERIDLEIDGQGSGLSFSRLFGGSSEIRLTEGTLDARNGSLQLDLTDLVIAGSDSPVMTLNQFVIESSEDFQTPVPSLIFESDTAWFPFDDQYVGEVVLAGSAGAVVVMDATSAVDAIRLESSVQTQDSSSRMAVNKRLVFGGNNASLITQSDGQLVLSEGATIVRRGRGTLNHDPLRLGVTSVGYNLETVSSTSGAPSFSGSSLTTGLELPASGIVQHLIVHTGAETEARRIMLDVDVRTNDLIVWSGTLDRGSSTVTFEPGGRIGLLDLDETSGAFLTGAPNSLILTSSHSFVGRFRGSSRVIDPELTTPGTRFASWIMDIGSSSSSPIEVVLGGSISAEQMTVNAVNDSELNLFGHSLEIGMLHAMAGRIHSDAASTMDIVTLNADPETRIDGNIKVISRGNATVQSTIDVLDWTATGNLNVGGHWNPASHLILNGENQLVIWTPSELNLKRFTLSSASASGLATIQIPTGGHAAISQGLILEQGVLSLDGLDIQLELGAILDVAPASWINGTLSRRINPGFTGSVAFPIGTVSQKRTLQLVITEPLLATSTFGVSVQDSDPFIELGLPWTDGNLTALDTDGFSWTLTSSVNFATSQPFSLSAPANEHSPVASTLLTRLSGNWDSAWTGSTLSSPSTLRSAFLDSGLGPSGLEIGVGRTDRLGPRGWIQVVTDAAWGAQDGPVAVDGIVVASSVPGSFIGSRIPVSVPTDVRSDAGSVEWSLPGQSTTSVLLREEETSFIVLVDTPSSGPAIKAAAPFASGLIPFNRSPAGLALSLSQRWPSQTTLVSDLEAGTFGEAFDADLSSALFIEPSEGAVSPVRLDSETSAYPRLLILDPSGSARLIESDGSETGSVNATGNSDPNVPGKTSLAIDQVYPNPSTRGPNLVLTGSPSGSARLELFDVLGRLIHASVVVPDGDQHTIQLQDLELKPGLYTVRVRSLLEIDQKTFIVVR